MEFHARRMILREIEDNRPFFAVTNRYMSSEALSRRAQLKS